MNCQLVTGEFAVEFFSDGPTGIICRERLMRLWVGLRSSSDLGEPSSIFED